MAGVKGGKYGSAELATGVPTLVATVPSDIPFMTLNIRYANDSNSPVTVKAQIGSGASPANKDTIVPALVLQAHTPFEDTGKVCSPGEKIWVTANGPGVSVRVDGIEAQ